MSAFCNHAPVTTSAGSIVPAAEVSRSRPAALPSTCPTPRRCPQAPSSPRRSSGRCAQTRHRTVAAVAPAAPYTAVMVVPTGVGAAIGGYAGDALPCARLLARVVDRLVTHPNVLNGALMYWPLENALYVEGFALDEFAAGRIALRPPRPPSNAVALVFDKALSPEARIRHIQVADAARATLGLRVLNYVVTDEPLGVELCSTSAAVPAHSSSSSSYTEQASESGGMASWGTIRRPDSLLRACRAAVDAGAEALAVVAQFPDDEDPEALAAYRAGSGVDAIAGAEAVISHLVTREVGVPCAHAPALPPLDADASVSPKSAAEELGYTFLSCVLVGLSSAPHLVQTEKPQHLETEEMIFRDCVTVDDVNAVIVPAYAFGGPAVMSLAARPNVLVVAVKSNTTTMNVPAKAVGIDESGVLYAASYAEAAGFLAAHKAGINIASLGTEVPRLEELQAF